MQQILISRRIATNLYNKRFNLNEDLQFIGDIIVEGNDYLSFIYFETYTQTDDYKRYHMVVCDPYYIEIYWYDSNVIDAGRGYTMQEIKTRFDNHLMYLLKKSGLEISRVFRDIQ
jgi:hypothetical protein